MDHVPPALLRRAATGAGAVALALATCTACVGSSTPAGGSAGSATTGAAGAITSPSASTPGAATSSAAAAAPTTAAGGNGSGSGSTTGSNSGSGSAPTTCQPSQLSGSIGSSQGAAGSVYLEIVFKNTGSRPCTLDGYPGVSLAAGSPLHQVGQPAARSAQVSPLKVTLLPNGHANAVLQVGDFDNWPASTCGPVSTTYLLVYPPNDTSQVKIPYTTTGCSGNVVTLHVQAVQPGAGQPPV